MSVQRVAEKYNGTAGFTDKGEAFEASIMFYGIEVGELCTGFAKEDRKRQSITFNQQFVTLEKQ